MPTPAEIRAELERRKLAASAPVQTPAPVAPVSNADAIRAELARRKAAAPAPMSQPDASPWGDGQAFDDMYARKPQTDPMLSPLRSDARTLTSGQPTRMKPPPAPRGPVMSPVQRQAMAPERAAAEAERRAAQERREAAAAFGGGMDMLPTMDAGGNVKPGTDIDRDIGAGITGTVSGIRPLNALSNTVEAAVNLPGDALQSAMGGERVIPRADIPSVPLPKELESVTGDLSQGIMQFLMARGVIGKAAPGGGMAAQAGKDAAAIFAGFDSDTPRMAETLAADFMRENGMGWMADRDPNNPLMERVKNGIEEMFLAYAPVEVARRTPQVVDAITGVGRLPNTPTNAGGANLAPAAPPVVPVAPAVAATQTAPQAPTQPQTVTAPPVPPIPPNAPAVTAGAPQPGPAGQVPPTGQLTPVSNLGPAEQAFNNLPMKTRESMLNAFNSAGVTPDRAKAMIGELNNLPDGQNTMYALEVMRRNGLSDADIDGVLIAMGREFATESPRPAGRVFNREQDSARQIMNDQVRTQINSEGRSITDVAERNFGEGVVPAGEALDLELDQLSNAYETILSTKRSPTGRLRSPAKKDAVYRAREDLTNALVSPEVMQTIPQDVKLQIMMQASDDMRRLKFTPDELGVILQGDGAVLAPLFNGYGALSWSPDLWSHLARQYPTQAAHSLQSALRKAADEAFRRGDATAGRYYKRLRGESGKGGLLDTLERAVPKYKETRVQFGDASSAKEALDILERFKAAAASEGDVAKIIKDLEGLPQRHREMAEQQITSIIRQELARKVESPRLAELGQTVAQTPNLTSLSRQDFLKALEDVFGPRGKELADAIRAARARTDTLTSISPKYNSRTELNRQDVQNAPALYEAPGSLEGGIIDAGVKRLGTVAGGASLIPGGQGAALALGAATAVQAAMNAARRGKRLSNAERNALVDFLFKSRTADDAAPPVATRGPSMGDYAQAIGRDAVIGAGVGAVADGDPLNNDPMALIGGAVGGAAGYGRARIRNARSLIKPPPAPRGAGRRNPPPAGPAVGGPNAPRPLPGQTSNSAPAVTGALVGGAAGYAAAPEDQKGLGLVAGIAGGGVVGSRFGKGSTPKPPAVKPKPGAWKRDPATVGLKTQDYLAYINAKHPPATPNQTPPYFVAASAVKRLGGNRQAAQAELADYAAYLKQRNAKPEVIENAERAARAVADVDPMFFDDAAFNARMRSEITAGGEAAVAPARGAANALPGERRPRPGPSGVKPPPVRPANDTLPKGQQTPAEDLAMARAFTREPLTPERAQDFYMLLKDENDPRKIMDVLGIDLNPSALSIPRVRAMVERTRDEVLKRVRAALPPSSRRAKVREMNDRGGYSDEEIARAIGVNPDDMENLGKYLDALDGRTEVTSQRKLLRGNRQPPPVKNGFGSRDLPMDEASVKARGTAMGFDMETPLYHGTNRDFDAFDTNAPVATDTQYVSGAVATTPIREIAEQYTGQWRTRLPAEERMKGGKVLSLHARVTKPFEVRSTSTDAMNAELRGKGVPSTIRFYQSAQDAAPRISDPRAFRAWLDENGYDALDIYGMKPFGDNAEATQWIKDGTPKRESVLRERFIFDPKNIRRTDAAFDPSESSSSKLLAGMSGNAEAIGAGTGAVFAPDADRDGEISFGERAGAAITGGVLGNVARRASGTGAPKVKPPMRGADQAGLGGRPKPPAPRNAPPKGAPGTLSRMVAGGTVGGLAGSLGGDANAQEDLTGKIAETEQTIADLKKAMADLDKITDPFEKQRFLKAQGYYAGKIDGSIMGKTTEGMERWKAKKEAELEKAEAERKDLVRRDALQSNRPDPLMMALREYGPAVIGIGALFGMKYMRGGAAKASIKTAEAASNKLNKLITKGPVTGAMNKRDENRFANLNKLWQKGGASKDELPFKQDGAGKYKPNAKAKLPEELFADSGVWQTVTKYVKGKDVAIILGGGLDVAIAQPFIDKANENLEKAEAAWNDTPSDETAKALEDAKNEVAAYTLLQRIGMGVAAGRILGTFGGAYAKPMPNIPAAASEQAKLKQFIVSQKPPPKPRAKAKPPAPKPKPKPRPKPPAPPAPPAAPPTSQLPLPLKGGGKKKP